MKKLSLSALPSLTKRGVRQAQRLTGRAELAVARFHAQSSSLSKWEQRIFGTLLSIGLLHGQAMAQAGVSTTLNNVKSTVLMIGQVLFAIFLMVALVKTVKKFLSGEPDAMTSLMWLVGGILLFFGFQALKDQIVTNTGGGAGGVQ